MTPRNHDKSDSDLDRRIREFAEIVFHQKSQRLWWGLGMLFVAGLGLIATVTQAKVEASENAIRIQENQKQIVVIRESLGRMDDKLDRLLQRR